jgi:hypothetical protein
MTKQHLFNYNIQIKYEICELWMIILVLCIFQSEIRDCLQTGLLVLLVNYTGTRKVTSEYTDTVVWSYYSF